MINRKAFLKTNQWALRKKCFELLDKCCKAKLTELLEIKSVAITSLPWAIQNITKRHLNQCADIRITLFQRCKEN